MEQIQHNVNIDLNQFNQHQDNIVKIQSLFRVGLAKNSAKTERLRRQSLERDAESFKIAMFALSFLAIANFTVFYNALKSPQILPTKVPNKL